MPSFLQEKENTRNNVVSRRRLTAPGKPHQPPHDGAAISLVSILSTAWLPHSGQANSFSSVGPLGTGTSKVDRHRRQVSSHVSVMARFFLGGTALHPEPLSGWDTDRASWFMNQL